MYDYYIEESEKLRNIGKDLNLTDSDIDRIIDESFKFLETEFVTNKVTQKCSTFSKKKIVLFSILIVAIACLCVLISSHQKKYVHSYIVRNFQVFVYPAMKLLRKIMLPVIEKFPGLTELYDEACLIGNPYFQVSDIDCWPCESVKSVLNLTMANLSKEEYHSGIPFIYRDKNAKEVNFDTLAKMYANEKDIFDKDAGKLDNSSCWVTPEIVFLDLPLTSHPSPDLNTHILWKINRLDPVREVRRLFGVPSRVPSYVASITIEKWLLIDEPKSPSYDLPWTEGTSVFLIQGSGSRLITLEPSAECAGTCHKVSILLRPNHVLWYNWWYWRGKSLPVSATNNKISITYIGSFY